MGAWKTDTEAYHGSRWGLVATALVILFFCMIIGVFMLALQGEIPVLNFTMGSLLLIIVVILAIFYMVPISALIKFSIWGLTAKFLYVVLILAVIAFLVNIMIAGVNTWNLIVVALCILAMIIFFPIAIFLVDLFTYED